MKNNREAIEKKLTRLEKGIKELSEKLNRKEIIMGFVDWFEKRTTFDDWDMPNMTEEAKEYLTSLGKGKEKYETKTK